LLFLSYAKAAQVTRTRRFLGGVGLGYLNQAVVIVVGVWLTRFLLGHLGAHEYGLWLVGLQILGYLMLADLGVVGLLPRETAYAKGSVGSAANGSDEVVRDLAGRTIRLTLWQLPLVSIASTVVWLCVPESWAALRGPLAILMIAFVVSFPLRVLPAILQGLQDLSFVGFAQLGSWAVATVTTVGLLVAGGGLTALAVGWVGGQVVLAAMCWVRLRRRYPGVVGKRLPSLSRSAAREYLAKSVWVSTSQVSQVLLVGTEVLVIGTLLGPMAVVPYVCTSKLISVIRNQPQIFLQAALPGLSEMRVSESRQKILQATAGLMQGTLILSGAAACLILVSNRWFVEWWVGPSYYSGFPLTGALLAVMIVRHVLGSVAYSVFAFGHEKQLALVGLADGVVTVGGTLVLVHSMGSIGAPIASLASACLVGLPPLVHVYARATGIPMRDALKPLVPWLVRFLVVVAPVGLIVAFRPPSSPLIVALATAGLLVVYGLLQVTLIMQKPLAMYVPQRAARLLGRFLSAKGGTTAE
jgi:O-antigen/teichoic acid export membrane protein